MGSRSVAFWLASMGLLAGCGGSGASDSAEPTTSQHSIAVRSTAFEAGDAIPVRYTCDGANTSPELSWTGVPDGARALALVVADPDAPGGTYYHWLVTDIPARAAGVAAGASPRGGQVQSNSAGQATYAGPCPPSGTHHYRFTVYALAHRLGLDSGASVGETISAIATAAVDSGTLVGTYSRR